MTDDDLFHPLRVLIADPNEDAAHLTATLCHNIGVLEVNTAQDPRDVVSKLNAHHYDLMILAHRFPPKGAVHLARLIHGSPKSPDRHLPIIILAGTVDRDEIKAARALKNCLFLLRPLSIKGFRDHVARLITTARAEEETKD